MHYLVLVFASLLSVSSNALAQAADDHASERAYILKAESDWAESVVTRDARVIERILADDFVGVGTDGSHYSKADEIKSYRTGAASFLVNHANAILVRFYGDTAIAQGSESWKKKDGTEGFFVWTDTWIRLNGKWQIVAAEDLIPPPTYPPQQQKQ